MSAPPVHHPPQMTGTKRCPRCKKDLPVIYFSVNFCNKDGLHSYCRDCVSAIIAQTPSKREKRFEESERKTKALKRFKAIPF